MDLSGGVKFHAACKGEVHRCWTAVSNLRMAALSGDGLVREAEELGVWELAQTTVEGGVEERCAYAVGG